MLSLVLQGDVRRSQDCERWVAETCARLGGLDILVNCAAGNFLVRLLLLYVGLREMRHSHAESSELRAAEDFVTNKSNALHNCSAP